jgi:hypothetical protein
MSFKYSTYSYWLFFLLTIVFTDAIGQVGILNNNPPSVKWRKISSPNFDIIYPTNSSIEAYRLSHLMEGLYTPVSASLGGPPHKIPIVLQNQNAISNGFVTISPRRSEFYYMPPQRHTFLGTNDWLELLAVHEFRHVVQFEHGNTGLTRLGHLAFGQNVRAFLGNIAVPLWFWEGDAVALETVMTPSGRGRIPEFDMLFRANLLERGGFNYHKQYLRSFKHNVPNHYVTGYLLSTYLRGKYDYNPWERITERAFKWPIIPFTFSLAMKKETGMGLERTYDASLLELEYLYREQFDRTELTESTLVHGPERKRTYTDYELPIYLRSGLKLALKSGIGDIEQWITWDEKGKEKVIYTPGIINQTGYATGGTHKIAWVEFEFDPRWRMRTYSVVKIFDTKKNKLEVLRKKTKHIAVAISPDDRYLALINANEQGKFNLEIWDLNVKMPVKKWDFEDSFISHVTWADNNEEITYVKHERGAKSVISRNVWLETERELIPPSNDNVAFPQKIENYLYYSAPTDGVDNIYAKDLLNEEVYQVVSSKYGAFHPSFSSDKKTMLYTDFTKDGFEIRQIELDESKWKNRANIPDRNINFFEPLKKQEGNWDLEQLKIDSTISFKDKPYHKIWSGLSIYEWGPLSGAPDNQLRLGIRAQNMLSTLNTSIGVGLRGDELIPFPFFNISYQGLYPIFNLNGYYSDRQLTIEGDTLQWREGSLGIQTILPLVLTNSRYFRSFTMSNNVAAVQVSNSPFGESSSPRLQNGYFLQSSYTLRYSRMLKTSRRDLTSRWGQIFTLTYSHTPHTYRLANQVFAGDIRLFVPGLFKHHHLVFRGGYVNRLINNFNLGNQITLNRGYFFYGANNMVVSSVDYLLPLWYPDIHLGPFVNFQRFRTQLFHDYGVDFINDGGRVIQQSFGADIFVDFNVMRYLPLLNAGVRVGFIPETKTPFFNFLLGGIGI